ncbi:cytochrome c oxidase subunit IVB [Aquibacillus sp. 3ASR75-11]|uniref:Cytochrome c oxidase subunit IVB n=1 Tax=Terrihalobacillus insolitus TaxID=2950438 RepID=A0A9X3WS90_9BACI|nr:cytochrome c oxidase subunit IVB [Terrihalobacillus insolitus]MDC3412800.1 cytochrome c oxidase subunit IVB [Terrihalobacillus insolitus]MDC3423723.1 cytochrome c oxidase subunit IVB [Terrihalobacillus insolitus]
MVSNSNSSSEYNRKKNKEEMKQQLITFTLMIVFTLIAFSMVIFEFDKLYVIPVLLILAVVQVIFQLYYFMHMKNKDHEMPAFMFYGGLTVATITILTLSVITWW